MFYDIYIEELYSYVLFISKNDNSAEESLRYSRDILVYSRNRIFPVIFSLDSIIVKLRCIIKPFLGTQCLLPLKTIASFETWYFHEFWMYNCITPFLIRNYMLCIGTIKQSYYVVKIPLGTLRWPYEICFDDSRLCLSHVSKISSIGHIHFKQSNISANQQRANSSMHIIIGYSSHPNLWFWNGQCIQTHFLKQ